MSGGRAPEPARGALALVAGVLVVATALTLVGAGPVGTAQAAPPTNVTNCTTIDSPGVYQLNQSVTNGTTLSCIDIAASDVVFDGQGFTVDGVDNDSGSAGVNVSDPGVALSNVTVRDVAVTNWGDPFSAGVVVENTSLGDGVDIVGVNATRNGGSGVEVRTQGGVVNITDSLFVRNAEKGVTLDSQGAPATLRNNTFRRNGQGGDAAVRLDGDGNYTFADNRFVESTEEGVRSDDLPASDTVTFTNDTFVNTAAASLDLASQPGTVVGTNVTFESPVATAVVDFESTHANIDETSTVPADPAGRTNIGSYLNASESGFNDGFVNVTFRYTEADVAAVDDSTLDVFKFNTSWTEEGTGPGTDLSANSVQLNVTTLRESGQTLIAPLAEPGVIESCTTIGAPGVYELNTSITDSPKASCINITASDVVFEGANNTIDGVVGTGTVGINVSNATTQLSNVTVRNVVVTDWARGVDYVGVSGGNVTGVNASLNEGPQILVGPTSDNVTVADNTVLDDRSTRAGIEVEGDDSVVHNNTLDGNYNTIVVDSGTGNAVTENNVTSGLGSGDVYVLRATDTLVADNTLSTSNRPVTLAGSTGIVNVTVRNNTATGGAYGIEVRGDVTDARIVDNDVTASGGNGIQVVASGSGPPTDVVARNNTVTGAAANGTLVDGAGNVTLTNNTIANSGDRGVFVNSSANVTIDGSETVINASTAAGVRLRNASNATVADGQVVDNGNGGVITEVAAPDLTIRDANVSSNDGADGILLLSASSFLVENVTASNNPAGVADGVGISSTGAGVIRGGEFTGNNRNGVRVTGTDDVRVVGANLSANGGFGVRVDGLSANTLVRDATAVDNAAGAVEINTDPMNTTVENLNVGASTNADTTVDFTGDDIEVRPVSSAPPAPANESDVGRYVNVTAAGSTPVINLTIQYTNADVSGLDEFQLDVWTYNRTTANWTERGGTLDPAANEIQYNATSFSVIAPFAPTPTASCLTIDSPGVYDLGGDVSNSTKASCINITASDVTFDGNGFTVDGVNSGGSVGINVSNATTRLSNVTVRNVTVTDWGQGVDVSETNRTEIRSTTVRFSNRSGIEVDNGTTVDVVDVTVLDNNRDLNTFDAGINLRDTADTSVRRSVARRNGFTGVSAFRVDGLHILDSRVTENCGSNLGLSLFSVNDTVVAGSNVSNNTGLGVQVSDGAGDPTSRNVTIRDTTVDDNGNSGMFVRAIDMTLRNVTANRNGARGITDGRAALMVGVEARNNTDLGIAMAADAVLRDAVVADNGQEEVDTQANATLDNVTVGSASATVSGTARSVKLEDVETPPTPPTGETDIGQFLDATNDTASSFFDVTFEYTDAQVSGVAESELDVWEYNTTSATWTELGGTLDAAANTLNVNITSFSVFAPLANTTFENATLIDPGVPEDLFIGERNQTVSNARVEGISDATIKLYYNVTPLAERNVNLGSLGVRNFTATNGTADQTNVNSNSGRTVIELTVKNLGSFDATNVSFELTGLDTTAATPDTGITYAANVTEGTSSDSRFDGSSGAPDADDPKSSPFAIGRSSSTDFRVNVTSTNSPVTAGSNATVNVTVTNIGGASGSQNVTLDVAGAQQDSVNVTLASGANTTVTLVWETTVRDVGTYTATVASDNDTDTATLDVEGTFFGANPQKDECVGDAPGGDNPNDNGENGGCRADGDR